MIFKTFFKGFKRSSYHGSTTTHRGPLTTYSGLEVTAGQWTMSRLIVDLTGQTFDLPVMLTGQNSIVLKMK